MHISKVLVGVLLSSAIALQAQSPNKDPMGNEVPQEPVVLKERSDAEDEGLRGKIRLIEYQTQSLRTSQANKGRQRTRVDEFTPSGNKYITSWYREGEMYLRNYFGYIDGFRVCRSYGSVGSQLDKLTYEYKDGKVAKETTFTGSGLIVTTTYAYANDEKDVRMHDQNGKLTQRLVFRYDAEGNETGYDQYDAADQVAIRVKFTYGNVDSAGNWTQRSSSYVRLNGREKSVPLVTEYRTITYYGNYNPTWFTPINDPNKPSWEILPQEAKAGEVILSKRNELGILSNFAAMPFEMDGKRYASVEGFWQMMLYPEGPDASVLKTNA
jgi:hypothetical protein